MTDLKYNQVLNFDDGLLTVKISGHGGVNGWATLSFKEEQFELDADGYQVVEIAPSELRELRDFLNRVIPGEPQASVKPERSCHLADPHCLFPECNCWSNR